MKIIASLTCMLLVSIATPALALQGGDCAARSQTLKPSERDAFMKSCLAKAGDPANVQEEERKQKSARCEQNARNKKLQGNEKVQYHTNCMNKNEAAAVANAQIKKTPEPKHRASRITSKSEPHKIAKKNKVHKKNANRNSRKPAKLADESKVQ
jgi:hypothetical protein